MELPMVQLGLGEGHINKAGPMPQPDGTIDTASRTLAHTGSLYVRSAANFTLGS